MENTNTKQTKDLKNEPYESDSKNIAIDFKAGDSIFTGYIYIIKTPEFNKVKRSDYGKGMDFRQDIIEVIGYNCYIPTSGICFRKCIDYLTGKDY